MKSISVDEIDEDLSADQLAKEIASMAATSDTAKKMDEVARNMSKLDASTQRAYSVMLSGDISGATQDFTPESFTKMAENLKLTEDELVTLFGLEGTPKLLIKSGTRPKSMKQILIAPTSRAPQLTSQVLILI